MYNTAKEWLDSIQKMMDDSYEKEQIRLKKAKKEEKEFNKEWSKMMKEKHLGGSVKINGESYLSYKEYKELLLEIYGDHLYEKTTGGFTMWLAGSCIRDMDFEIYKYWIKARFKSKAKLFEDGL